MKRAICLFLVAVALLAMSACGSEKTYEPVASYSIPSGETVQTQQSNQTGGDTEQPQVNALPYAFAAGALTDGLYNFGSCTVENFISKFGNPDGQSDDGMVLYYDESWFTFVDGKLKYAQVMSSQFEAPLGFRIGSSTMQEVLAACYTGDTSHLDQTNSLPQLIYGEGLETPPCGIFQPLSVEFATSDHMYEITLQAYSGCNEAVSYGFSQDGTLTSFAMSIS